MRICKPTPSNEGPGDRYRQEAPGVGYSSRIAATVREMVYRGRGINMTSNNPGMKNCGETWEGLRLLFSHRQIGRILLQVRPRWHVRFQDRRIHEKRRQGETIIRLKARKTSSRLGRYLPVWTTFLTLRGILELCTQYTRNIKTHCVSDHIGTVAGC